MNEDERNSVIDMIASGPIPPDPSLTKYRTTPADRSIAYGLFMIELILIPPIVLPLIVLNGVPRFGALISYMIGAAVFAYLGHAYARELNRNRIIAVVLMGGLLIALAIFTYSVGW